MVVAEAGVEGFGLVGLQADMLAGDAAHQLPDHRRADALPAVGRQGPDVEQVRVPSGRQATAQEYALLWTAATISPDKGGTRERRNVMGRMDLVDRGRKPGLVRQLACTAGLTALAGLLAACSRSRLSSNTAAVSASSAPATSASQASGCTPTPAGSPAR